MPAASDRADFAPPQQPAAVQAFVLAIIAHLLLLLALTWGINWKRESENVVVEAELWSSIPQQAAPRVVQAPPITVQAPPPPVPVPAPPPPPPPPPAPPAPRVITPPPAPVPAKAPDIALEREKKKQELAERRREELERQKKIDARKEREELEREKKILEARRKQEELKRERLTEQKAADERNRREEQAKAAKDKQREQADAKRMAALREENLRRMQGLAGKAAPNATGDAERSAGPSSSYAGRIRARVKPNITFTDDVPGNPTADVEVRMAPDGTITSKRVVKSSGVRSWDDAVLRALDKTEVLPRDVDGRVHSPLIIEFKLRG